MISTKVDWTEIGHPFTNKHHILPICLSAAGQPTTFSLIVITKSEYTLFVMKRHLINHRMVVERRNLFRVKDAAPRKIRLLSFDY
jgi:desulfoferrodoxin (superoxide reductase-like protein)